MLYKKKVRAQRRILSALKTEKTIDNENYKKFYRLVKGGTFQTKISLINHIKSQGVPAKPTRRTEQLRHI